MQRVKMALMCFKMKREREKGKSRMKKWTAAISVLVWFGLVLLVFF